MGDFTFYFGPAGAVKRFRIYERAMEETTRAGRLGVVMDPHRMDLRFGRTDAMWAETEEQREERLERAQCRDVLLEWVRARLEGLSPAQRVSVELHYFEGLTLEQAAKRLGKDRSSVHRAEKRAVRVLRSLKRTDRSWIVPCRIYRNGSASQ